MKTTISFCFSIKLCFAIFFPVFYALQINSYFQGQQELLDNFQTLIQKDDVTQNKNCHSGILVI